MIIKTSYEAIQNVIGLMKDATSTKAIQEDFKVVNFFVKDSKLKALSTDGQLFCLNTFNGEYDLEGENNPFMTLRIKDIKDILDKYSSLQRTQVREVILATQQKGVVMTVVEEPKIDKGDSFAFSDMYKNQATRFKLTTRNISPIIAKELPALVMPVDCIEIPSKDLQKYLEYMYAPMSKPRETCYLHFTDEFVYSIMGNIYGVSMPNILPQEIFSEISLSLPVMKFLSGVLPKTEKFKIYKDVKRQSVPQPGVPEEDWSVISYITLYIEVGNTLIKITTLDRTKDGNVNTFKELIPNCIEIDKPYLIDSLKRIDGYDQVFLEIDITEDENVAGTSRAEFIIKTSNTIQKIPVKSAHGSGSYRFMLKPESVHLLMFTHLTKDMDGDSDKINDLILFMMKNPTRDTIALSCNDKSESWQSRWPHAPIKEAPLLDF